MDILNKLFHKGDSSDKELSVEAAHDAYEAKSAEMVDVREPNEWADGHMPGARHIPLGDLAERWREIPTGRPIITICRSGKRSLMAQQALVDAGLTDVKSMAGGMNAWADKGYEVEKGS